MNNKSQTEELEFAIFDAGEEKPGLFLQPKSAGPGDFGSIQSRIRMLKINRKMAEEFAAGINLTYLEEEGGEGNVCMANNDEVLPEFREICTGSEIRKYVISCLRSAKVSEQVKNIPAAEIKIPLPKDATAFWKAVDASRQ